MKTLLLNWGNSDFPPKFWIGEIPDENSPIYPQIGEGESGWRADSQIYLYPICWVKQISLIRGTEEVLNIRPLFRDVNDTAKRLGYPIKDGVKIWVITNLPELFVIIHNKFESKRLNGWFWLETELTFPPRI